MKQQSSSSTLVMKILVILGFIVLASLESQAGTVTACRSQEASLYYERMGKLRIQCAVELGSEKVKNAPELTGLIQYPENNDSLNAIWGCFFEKMGIINEHSDIDEEELKSYIWELFVASGNTNTFYWKEMIKLAKHCKTIKGDGDGHTAVKLQNCVMHYIITKNLRK